MEDWNLRFERKPNDCQNQTITTVIPMTGDYKDRDLFIFIAMSNFGDEMEIY